MRRVFLAALFVLLALPAGAQVSFDAGTMSHADGGCSASEASFSWSHTAGASPEGAIVFTTLHSYSSQVVSSVSYGASSMTEITAAEAIDTAGEPGRTRVWFLGSSVPTSTQTVQVNRSNNSAVVCGFAISVNASGDTETTGTVLVEENQAVSEQSVDDGSPGSNSLRVAGMYHGANACSSAGANSTEVDCNDVGSRHSIVVYETTPGQGSRLVGFSGGNDDVAASHIAIREVSAGPTCNTSISLMGVGCR